MKYTLLAAFILLVNIQHICAQHSSYFEGKVTDKVSNKPLMGVSIRIKELPFSGMLTDSVGFYRQKLPHGDYTCEFSLLGYKKKEVKIQVSSKIILNVSLESKAMSLSGVEVTAKRPDENVRSVELGSDQLQVKLMNKIPVLFGEKDILKTLQLLPGVQSVGEGNTGFYVRGGASDQNLVLLDGGTVYNPSHLFGFFSTFNSDDVDGMTLYKGTMPAQYGGRLSSVLDVDMKDGNMNGYNVSGGIGLISSRLTVEGPIQKGKSSFIVSGRRTYADLMAKAAGVKEVQGSSMYFYDLNAKLNYVFSDRDRVSITAYNGRDMLGMKQLVGFNWGNTIASIRWKHLINNKALLKTNLSYTDYRYNVKVDFSNDFSVKSHITDYNLNEELSLHPNDKNAIKIGYSSIYHGIVPGELKSDDPKRFNVRPFMHRNSWENAIYANHTSTLSNHFEIGYGLRFSAFTALGGGDYYKYDNQQNVTDTIHTKKGQFVKTYWSLEPRIGMTYRLNKTSSLKFGFTRTEQNLHLLQVSNMEITPSDRWMPSTNYIKPEISNQVSLGYYRNFNNNMFEFSAEVYYKDLRNQIDYKDGSSQIFRIDNVEPYLLFGKGRAYGLELFLKKKYGRFNGWIGYTLSKSEKKINGINHNNWYVSNQDRTNDVSVVAIYDLSKKWSLSGTWIYATGAPMTFPSGKYIVDGHILPYFDGRNQYRAPAYHRMDLGATCILKKTKNRLSELVFSIYNVYGRKNPFMYGFRQNEDDPSKSEAYMIYLFRMIPSITWDFKF